MDLNHQSEEHILTLNKDLNPELLNQDRQNNINSQSILPRKGWQDNQAFVRAIIKAKKALDIEEISRVISF
jgi:hypothetical protein